MNDLKDVATMYKILNQHVITSIIKEGMTDGDAWERNRKLKCDGGSEREKQ